MSGSTSLVHQFAVGQGGPLTIDDHRRRPGAGLQHAAEQEIARHRLAGTGAS